MTDILTTLHPENDADVNLYPNVKKENIPNGSIDLNKLDENVISFMGSLKPSGVDTSANILAKTSDDGIWIGSDTGLWYYWNGSQYVSGGIYQGTELNDDSVDWYKTNFIKLGKNLYNIDTAIDGYYIGYTSGNMFVNSNFFASDYILIDSDKEYLNLSPIGDPQIAFYDVSKTYISGIHGNPPFAIPTNARYIRISNLLSCKICQLEYGQTATPYEKYYLDFDYPKENNIDIDYNSKHNGIDTESYTLNAYWNNQGNIVSGTGANALNNITKLKPNTTYKVYPNYALYPNYTWLCQNENKANKINISNFGYTITNGTFTTDDTHIYMLTTLRVSVNNTIKVVNGDIPNNNLKYGDNLISMSIENHTFYVGARREFTKIIDGIAEAVKYPNSIVYVDDGVYDLVEEFGQEYLDNTTTDVGIILSNKIHIIFSSNSKVLFNYSGANAHIHTNFSPFNSGVYGFTLENLNLECSNCRYCVHDERGNTTDDYINKYINCTMNLDNSNNPDWNNPQNIGGGLGSKGYIEIVGCIFNNAITYHNNNGTQTDCKSKVIIKDCYLKSNGIIITGYNSNITKVSEFIITNTHTDYISVVDTIPNVVVYQWNNDIY